MNRALRAATTGVLLLAPLGLAACGAGQVTQTATQERDKSGPMAQVGSITLRNVEFPYPSGGVYDEGDDADLTMAIVNTALEEDRLVGVEGEGFEEVEITGGDTGAGSGGSGSGGSSEIAVPGDSVVYVGEDGTGITLVGLEEELTAAEFLELTLTFENAGEVTVIAAVGNPARELPREEGFDFHEEEEASEGQEENTEVAGGGNPENNSDN